VTKRYLRHLLLAGNRLTNLWRQRGDEILHRVADQYPEMIFSGLIKLAKVTRIEVGSPGDFAKLGKQGIPPT
jgi:hypothetical protein